MTEAEHEEWLEAHRPTCERNYDEGAAAGGMEAAAAVAMWGRFKDHGFLYKTFLSDGDSSAFLSVKKMCNNEGPYGAACSVKKAECVNHVSKRLGTALRNLKKATKKKGTAGYGGKNKLTDVVIDSLQYYYKVSLNRKIETVLVR